MLGNQEVGKKKVESKSINVSGDKAAQLAAILDVELPESGEISVFHAGQGLEYGDYMEDMALVLKQREQLRILIVAQCW